jgi:hypothetical protein
MNWFMAIYFAILFFILSPGVLLKIPANGSKLMVAGVHAIVFGLVCFITEKFVWNLSNKLNFFEGAANRFNRCNGPQCGKNKGGVKMQEVKIPKKPEIKKK